MRRGIEQARLFRVSIVAGLALCAACVTEITSVAVPRTVSLTELATKAAGTNQVLGIVLKEHLHALDSLYALRFGAMQRLPMAEEEVVGAAKRAVERNALFGVAPDTGRIMRELGLSSQDVTANFATVMEVYRRVAAYDVYVELMGSSARNNLVVVPPIAPPGAAPFNEAEKYLFATHPLLIPCTLASILDAQVSARVYYLQRGGELSISDVVGFDATRANAYLHAYWNMAMVKQCGHWIGTVEEALQWAKDFSDAHEFGEMATSTSVESEMDLHNNRIGRSIVGPLASVVQGNVAQVQTPPLSTLADLAAVAADRAVLAQTFSQMLASPSTLVYIRPPLVVRVEGTGAGRVHSQQSSIDCKRDDDGDVSGSCKYDVWPSVAPFDLIVEPDPGSSFAGWSGDCSGTTCTIEADRARTVTATLVKIASYSISATGSPTDGGSISGTGLHVAGTSVTLTATPAAGFTFTRWLEGGTQVSVSNPVQFTATSSRSLVAVFSPAQPTTYSINVTASPVSGGTVSGGGSYVAGTSVVVTATPSAGFAFVRWNEGGVPVFTSASYSFAATASRTLVAVFEQVSPTVFTITASASPSNGGTVTGTGTYPLSASITLVATPSTGYAFNRWTEGGTQISTTATLPFQAVANRSLVAHFTAVASPLAVVTTSLPNATVGSPYQQFLAAAGGSSPYSWLLASGSLPSGMTLSSGGTISGTPSGAGTSNFDVTVRDNSAPAQTATRSLSITVGGASPAVSVTTNVAIDIERTEFKVGASFDTRGVSAQLGYEWGLSSSLSTYSTAVHENTINGSGSGILVLRGLNCGTTYYYRAILTPGGGNTVRGDILSARTLNCSSGPPLSITTTALNPATATVGVGYAAVEAVTATGGRTPYTWSASGLPSGLSINSTTGAVFGTPTASGSFSPSFTVRDASAPQQTASKVLSLNVVSAAPVELITNGAFANGSQGWSLSGDAYTSTTLQRYNFGPGYAFFGTTADGTPKNSAIGIMQQTFTIPAGRRATLRFWYFVTTEETSTSPSDVLNVTLQTPSGTFLGGIATFANGAQGSGYSLYSIDISQFAGQTVRLNFLGTSNASRPTVFRIDDVSVIAQ